MFRARDREVVEIKTEKFEPIKLENVNGVEYVVLDDNAENPENSTVVQPAAPPRASTPPKSRSQRRAKLRAEKEAKLSPKSREWLKIRRKLKSKSASQAAVQEQLAILTQPSVEKKRKRKSDFDPFGEAAKQAEAAAKKPAVVNASSDPRVIVDPNFVPQRINNGLPDTPPHYWDLDFPTIERQRELGYFVEADSPLIKDHERTRRR
ncbi:hypothetical protein M3Y99_01231600 [Aphelenchoides fujianensis]|nr:hypothetical protein M3Y99_01231600 [Aphelenchoides fujianensis]